MARQSLEDEVRAAVQGLKWPPLLPRKWILPNDAGGGSEATANPGVECTGFTNAAVADAVGGLEERTATRFKVLTWNILCDGLSGSHPKKGGFLNAPEGSLDWNSRR
ncbi:unnamed protein product [Sphacelaria rigidula]